MVADYAQGIQNSFLATSAFARSHAAASTAPASTASSDDGFSFGDLLDVVNPLQHIPIISTLYRHITGDTIKPLEKIAGDTLYGGLTGLGSSIADYAFEKITGKNVGDTVMAFLGLDDSASAPATAVATATPAAATVLAQATHAPTPLVKMADATTPDTSGSQILLQAAQRNGVSSDMALRALSAYRNSLLMPKVTGAAVP